MQFEINSKNNYYIILCLLLISDIAVLLDLPIIRQFIVFFLITVLPGFLILKLLKLPQINRLEILLLSIGLSIFILMFVGAYINMISLSIGISNPLSLYPLLSTINISILILSSLCYKFNTLSFQISCNKSSIQKIVAPFLFLLQIPLIGILGALVVQYYTNSIFSLLFIFYIIMTVFFVTYNRFIPSNLYPLSIFMISFALLLNRTLTSPYLFGSDIHYEYYFARLAANSFWDSSLNNNVNAMLSVTILPNIYSTLLNMSLIYVYKIIYSFIFSFVPLGLYEIYRLQIGNRDAFLSVFFAMSFYAFFLIMPWLPRQQIAELYIVLLMIILITKNISSMKKTILFIIFICSLIVSHYGTTYIFLFYLVFVSLGLLLIKATDMTISPTKVILSCIMALSWYIYVSSSSVFSSIVYIADHIYSVFFNEIFSSSGLDPAIYKGLGIGITDLKFVHAMGNIWGVATEIAILIGLFYTIYKYREMKFSTEYLLFSLVNIFFILLSAIVPYLASSFLMYRIYLIALLFLSPFCIIGVESILIAIFSTVKFHTDFLKFSSIKYAVLMALLIPYFLFNTGFIYEVVEKPYNYGFTFTPADINKDYYSYWSYLIADPIPTQDVIACNWISDKIDSFVYVDELRRCEITGYGMILNTLELTPTTPKNQVIYLGYQNIIEGNATYQDPQKVERNIKYNISKINPSLETRNKIYTNNGSAFYV